MIAAGVFAPAASVAELLAGAGVGSGSLSRVSSRIDSSTAISGELTEEAVASSG